MTHKITYRKTKEIGGKISYNGQRGKSMKSITVSEIEKQIEKLPEEKLIVLYDFVNQLLEKGEKEYSYENSNSYEIMLASEEILKRDWEKAEEDKAWANL